MHKIVSLIQSNNSYNIWYNYLQQMMNSMELAFVVVFDAIKIEHTSQNEI